MSAEFDPITLKRLSELQKRLDAAESRLRSIAGKLRNRIPASAAPAANSGNGLLDEPVPSETELFETLALDLRPPSRAGLSEQDQKLKKQALSHLQKTKVDPQLWKDLASS